jgi:hypothetical protein
MSTPAPQAININLTEISARYNSGIQRLFDIASATVGGLRVQSNSDYDAFTKAAGFFPDGRSHQTHEQVRPVAEQWLVRSLLTEALNMITPLLEDVRSVAALAVWKSTDEANADGPRVILETDREASLKSNLGERIQNLRTKYNVHSYVEGILPGLFQLNTILAQHGGKVPKEFLGATGEWVLGLVTLIVEKAEGNAQPNAKLGRTDRRFALESTVSLEKADVLLAIGSVGFYASTLLASLQEFVKKTLPGLVQEA